MRRSAGRAAVLLIGTLIVFGSLALAAGPADAHASLVSSSPRQGQRLERPPNEVTFTFDQNVRDPAYVAVTGPDGGSLASGEPQLLGPVVRQQVTSTAVSGTYTMAYRVVSADGHPVTGRVTFEVGGGSRRPDSDAQPAGAPRGFVADHLVELGAGAGLLLVVGLLHVASVREEE